MFKDKMVEQKVFQVCYSELGMYPVLIVFCFFTLKTSYSVEIAQGFDDVRKRTKHIKKHSIVLTTYAFYKIVALNIAAYIL